MNDRIRSLLTQIEALDEQLNRSFLRSTARKLNSIKKFDRLIASSGERSFIGWSLIALRI
jgi:hypothetical protein